MKLEIARRSIRYSEPLGSLKELPALSGVKLVSRLIRIDNNGNFMGLQYYLRYDNESYTVDLAEMEDWEDFENYLDEQFKEAGVKPKVAKGTIQHYSETGESDVDKK